MLRIENPVRPLPNLVTYKSETQIKMSLINLFLYWTGEKKQEMMNVFQFIDLVIAQWHCPSDGFLHNIMYLYFILTAINS